ncbi:MAG: STAS domain-containing protein [Chitinispirillia bacterium]|nr:STAS domain-containing protein [Chitinispirillia bacterium]MCL2269499.1 STAS domain-containing protein [Chitinispirillia bacterium]
MNCYEMTDCSQEQRDACIVYRNFHNNTGNMGNISCWILKSGSPGWTAEDAARCAECPYRLAVSRNGVTVRHTERGAVLIVCNGTLNLLRTEVLSEVTQKIKAQKKNKVILDISAVNNIYSSAMSMIVRLHLQCEELGGKLVMAGATGYVKVALDTVSIDKFVICVETVEEAEKILAKI